MKKTVGVGSIVMLDFTKPELIHYRGYSLYRTKMLDEHLNTLVYASYKNGAYEFISKEDTTKSFLVLNFYLQRNHEFHILHMLGSDGEPYTDVVDCVHKPTMQDYFNTYYKVIE